MQILRSTTGDAGQTALRVDIRPTTTRRPRGRPPSASWPAPAGCPSSSTGPTSSSRRPRTPSRSTRPWPTTTRPRGSRPGRAPSGSRSPSSGPTTPTSGSRSPTNWSRTARPRRPSPTTRPPSRRTSRSSIAVSVIQLAETFRKAGKLDELLDLLGERDIPSEREPLCGLHPAPGVHGRRSPPRPGPGGPPQVLEGEPDAIRRRLLTYLDDEEIWQLPEIYDAVRDVDPRPNTDRGRPLRPVGPLRSRSGRSGHRRHGSGAPGRARRAASSTSPRRGAGSMTWPATSRPPARRDPTGRRATSTWP